MRTPAAGDVTHVTEAATFSTSFKNRSRTLLDGLLPSAAQLNSLTEAADRYRQNVQGLASYLDARGIGEAAALGAHLGLVSDPIPGHERFAGWMSIPYRTLAGVVGMKFRCIQNHDCKAVKCQRWDSPSAQTTHLYNAGVFANPRLERVAICEGEPDTILSQYELGLPAVGTAAGIWLDHWPRCFADIEEIIIIADHDVKADGSSPGLKHARKVQLTLPRARVVTPPPGMDLGEWMLSEGREAVLKGLGL